jgi:hypothetical protein
LTNDALGTLNTSTGNVVSFTANGTAGVVTLFVNATLNNVTVMSAPAFITVSVGLLSVSVNPSSVTVPYLGTQVFTAVPTCITTCHTGIVYSWNLSNGDWYALNISSGPSVTYTALDWETVALFVNATFDRVTVMSAPINITIPLGTPANVSVDPSSATLPVGGSQLFDPNIACTGGLCPEGMFNASLSNNTMGSIGFMLIFTAGYVVGTVNLFIGFTPTPSGTDSVTVMSAPVHISIVASLVPIITSFSVTPTTAFVNSWTNFSVSAGGGVGVLSYSYTGLPPGCASENESVLGCRPTSTGTYNVTVNVTDQANHSTKRSVVLTVVPVAVGPMIDSFVATPAMVTAGFPTTVAVTTTGGVGTLSYRYTGLPPGCSSQNVASASCTPVKAGSYVIRVYVNDSAGHSATTTTTLTVTAQPAPSSSIFGLPGTEGDALLYGALSVVAIASIGIALLLGRSRPSKEERDDSPPPTKEEPPRKPDGLALPEPPEISPSASSGVPPPRT